MLDQPLSPDDVRQRHGPGGTPPLRVTAGRLVVVAGDTAREFTADWLRQRTTEVGDLDGSSRQRLADPIDLPQHLSVCAVRLETGEGGPGEPVVVVTHSDGATTRHRYAHLLSPHDERRGGVAPDGVLAPGIEPVEALPARRPWTASTLGAVPRLGWSQVDDEERLLRATTALHRDGVLVVTGTPARPGALRAIARTFGRISATTFGELFDVRADPNPDDLAYTSVALGPHTDQPYRTPVPGYQFLHAISNDARGGDSIAVDGLAAVEHLAASDPTAFEVLAAVDVVFRYDVGDEVVADEAPIIDLDRRGRVRTLRFSPRLDFTPLLDPDVADRFHAARRRLAELLVDPARAITWRLEPGDCLIVDNHRVLHGRTAFDPGVGHRHLQGCYVDRDGPAALWRRLIRRRAHRERDLVARQGGAERLA